ncbi:MAG: dockerin type I domain-containing protein [Fimbriimonadales bacterium]
MRTILALGLTSVLTATTYAQVVLGNGAGSVRAVNALAGLESSEQPLQWSRRNFQDGTNTEIFGFYPAYTIQVNGTLFDVFGENVGAGGATTPVTITTVASLQSAPYNWPANFTIPQYLFRQGGAYTNENGAGGNRQLYGPVWIKYALDSSNPDGWNVVKVQVFAWDVRDLIHKSSATKARSFSDTGAPFRIDVYVAQNDPNPANDPASDPNWTFVGTLSKADGTLPNVCEWDPNTGNTFGECPQATLDYLNGANSQGLKFYQDPTNDLWYSTLHVSGQSGIRYVALVIPQGNQYNNDPDLVASSRVASALRYTNFTDVRVIAGPAGPEGDVNGDGCVDDADLLQVLFAFGSTGSDPADVNRDGIVDDADLLIVLFNFGAGC